MGDVNLTNNGMIDETKYGVMLTGKLIPRCHP